MSVWTHLLLPALDHVKAGRARRHHFPVAHVPAARTLLLCPQGPREDGGQLPRLVGHARQGPLPQLVQTAQGVAELVPHRVTLSHRGGQRRVRG